MGRGGLRKRFRKIPSVGAPLMDFSKAGFSEAFPYQININQICNCAWDNQRRECRNLGFCVECREDRNCRTGERCSSSGVCVKDQRKAFVGKPCRFNSDCPAPASRASSGGFLGSLSKFLSCDRKTGRCPECDFDFDCPGKSCKSGNCV